MNMGFFAVNQDFARLRAVNTPEHLNQRGFTSAVFAQDSMHLSAAQVKVQIIQSLYPGKRFADAAHNQQWML